MTFGWMVVALLPVVGHAATREVTAYFGAEGTASTSAARLIVAATLRKANVAITWQGRGSRASDVPRAWLRIELVEGTPDERLPAVLAFSYPHARCSKGITVFLDRVRSLANGTNRESALLGYVLAHEITHVIQGVNRHSETGIMKAQWNEADRAAIFERRLGYEAADVLLMRQGLAGAWCGEATALRDPSGPGTAGRQE